MRNETVLSPKRRALSVTAWMIVAALIGGPGLSGGPYPTVAGLAETVVGLAERALLTAGTVWLAIALLQPPRRGRTPEVTR